MIKDETYKIKLHQAFNYRASKKSDRHVETPAVDQCLNKGNNHIITRPTFYVNIVSLLLKMTTDGFAAPREKGFRGEYMPLDFILEMLREGWLQYYSKILEVEKENGNNVEEEVDKIQKEFDKFYKETCNKYGFDYKIGRIEVDIEDLNKKGKE